MPGEQLMCVWQAAYSKDPTLASISREALKSLTRLFVVGIPSLTFDCDMFDNSFSGTENDFESYKNYVTNEFCTNMKEKQFLDDVEEICWSLSKPSYTATVLNENDLKKLWKVVNRFLNTDTYPPTVCPNAVMWIEDKLATLLAIGWHSDRKSTSCTFQDMLTTLENKFFYCSSQEQVSQAIDNLYSWIVEEVMKSGWVNMRVKKQDTWTSWSKRWCVLTSEHLVYCNGESLDGSHKRLGEFCLTTNTSIESVDDYNGIFKKIKNRFRVSTLPQINQEAKLYSVPQFIELSQVDGSSSSWMSEISKVIQLSKVGTTPMKKSLKDKYSSEPISEYDGPVSCRDEEGSSTGKINKRRHDFFKVQEKVKIIFMEIDKNGNGKIDFQGFENFTKKLGLGFQNSDVIQVFKAIDQEESGCISWEDFMVYFTRSVLSDQIQQQDGWLHTAMVASNAQHLAMPGDVNLKELSAGLWEKRRWILVTNLLRAFHDLELANKNDRFKDYLQQNLTVLAPDILSTDMLEFEGEAELTTFEKEMNSLMESSDGVDITQVIHDKWNETVTDVVSQDLLDLVCLSIISPTVPDHTTVKTVQWVSSPIIATCGQLVFPADFTGQINTVIATNGGLRYYGCHFAEGNELKVSQLYYHEIQDFSHENNNLKGDVNCRIERHTYSHLDCPLVEDSGIVVLAKFVGEDEMHITGFKVPLGQSLYIPGGVIHIRRHLKGTWRTLLSADTTDSDCVKLVKQNNDDKFDFTFV